MGIAYVVALRRPVELCSAAASPSALKRRASAYARLSARGQKDRMFRLSCPAGGREGGRESPLHRPSTRHC